MSCLAGAAAAAVVVLLLVTAAAKKRRNGCVIVGWLEQHAVHAVSMVRCHRGEFVVSNQVGYVHQQS
jgi:hypothetical protein